MEQVDRQREVLARFDEADEALEAHRVGFAHETAVQFVGIAVVVGQLGLVADARRARRTAHRHLLVHREEVLVNLVLVQRVELVVHQFAVGVVVFHLQQIHHVGVVLAVLHLESVVRACHVPAFGGRGLPFYHLAGRAVGLEIGHAGAVVELVAAAEGALLQDEDGPGGVFMQLVFLFVFRLFGAARSHAARHQESCGQQ